jgi:phosphoadenosine phosphosulfate reductase
MRFLDPYLADTDLTSLSATDRLRWAWDAFGARAAIGTSFQGAGLVAIHLARSANLPIAVFTLDTGLLFPETVTLKARLEVFWGITIEALQPSLTVEEQEKHIGPDLWKDNPDFCCTLRKVEPLRMRLEQADCWITGLRREQSSTRADTGVLEKHEIDGQPGRFLWKLNPLADWSRDAVWEFIRRHEIPYNPLHDRGYRSIGCSVCTKPTSEGGDERAGRWTGFNKTECGIHTFTKKVDTAERKPDMPAAPETPSI